MLGMAVVFVDQQTEGDGMGFARLNGIDFYGIPLRSSCLYYHEQITAHMHSKLMIRHERYDDYLRSVKRLNSDQKKLVSENIGLVEWMFQARKIHLFRRMKADFIKMYMFDGLVSAASNYNPEFMSDGKPVRFSTYACKCMNYSIISALKEYNRQVKIGQFKSDSLGGIGNITFVPDPVSVKGTNPYDGFNDEQWRALEEAKKQNESTRDIKKEYEIALRKIGYGETLKSIGDELGITRGRVRQLIANYKRRVLKAYRSTNTYMESL